MRALPAQCFGVFALICGIWLTSPPAPGQDEPRRRPTFRTGVNTVLVDALVLDEQGLPVRGLTREDFTVFENGEEQSISSFDVTDWKSYVSATTNGGSSGGSDLEPSDAKLNAYPRRFVFVLNRQGARFDYLVRAKQALSEFIVDWMADGDEATLVDIAHSTKVVLDSSPQKEELLESVRKLSVMQVDPLVDADRAARHVYRSLVSLSESLNAIPGRKIVVLLSMELATFAMPGSRLSSEVQSMKQAIDALNQANASIYTIDLSGSDGYNASLTGGLAALANETGGRYFRNHVTFGPPLRRVGRENQRYYLLGYQSTNSELDGSYRRIVVRLKRDGLTVVSRPGYYARADEGDLPTAPPNAGLDIQERSSWLLPRAVEITSYLLRSDGGRVRVPTTVALPSELVRPRGNGQSRLDLVITRAEDGESVHHASTFVSAERFFLLEQTELTPGAYVASISLSAGSEEIYRSTTAINVPSGYGDRFGLSSILPIVSPEQADDVGSDLPLLPSSEIPLGTRAHVLFQVFSGLHDPSTSATVHFVLRGSDGRELRSGTHEERLRLSEREHATPVILSLPTEALREGTYRVEVVVEDPSRDRRATSELEIRVR